MTTLNPILTPWTHAAQEARELLIMPDGCRDIIVHRGALGGRRSLVSPLMPVPERLAIHKGDRYLGVRLKPGARINHALLSKAPTPQCLPELIELAQEASALSVDVTEALSCLGKTPSPSGAAQELGVSLRTLQRHTLRNTGRPPDFWRRLARARKAARLVLSGGCFTEIAFDCCFADQAHMTRELKHWFTMTPGLLAGGRHDSGHAAWGVCHPGYDAAETGEQISIK